MQAPAAALAVAEVAAATVPAEAEALVATVAPAIMGGVAVSVGKEGRAARSCTLQ
jgi:hypothetical protein